MTYSPFNSFNGTTTAATKCRAKSKNSDSSCSCNQYIFFNYLVILQLSDINEGFSSKCCLRVSLNYRSSSASVIVFYIKWLSHLSQPKLKVLWIPCFTYTHNCFCTQLIGKIIHGWFWQWLQRLWISRSLFSLGAMVERDAFIRHSQNSLLIIFIRAYRQYLIESNVHLCQPHYK